MASPSRRQRWPWVLLAGIVAVSTAARVPMLHRVLNGAHAFRQAQTAWAIRLYARQGIHLLYPPLPILGPPWRLWLELPLPQAVASFFVRAGMSSSAAGRLLGLLSLQVTAVLLFVLIRRWANVRAAMIAVVLLETVPLTVWWGAASLIEFFVTSLVLGSLLALQRFLDSGRWWWWAAAAACSALTWMVKVTTGSAWVLPLLVMAFLAGRPDWRARWKRSALGLVAAPGAGLVGELWWSSWATVHNDQSRFTVFQTPAADHHAVIGTLSERFELGRNYVLIHRMGELMTGNALLYVAAVVVVALAARNRLFLLSLASVSVVGAELWLPLYHHDYYPCAVVPAVEGVMGVAIDIAAARVVAGVRNRRYPLPRIAGASMAAVAVLGILALGWTSGFGQKARADLTADLQTPWESVVMREHTAPDAKIVMVGCSWDSKYLYNADRWGLMYMTSFGRLSPQYVLDHYQYAMSCKGPRMLRILPRALRYQPVAQGLYRIAPPPR